MAMAARACACTFVHVLVRLCMPLIATRTHKELTGTGKFQNFRKAGTRPFKIPGGGHQRVGHHGGLWVARLPEGAAMLAHPALVQFLFSICLAFFRFVES